ncbi:MAG: amidohydrolase family protein, partial [Candidatus Bathyarchaeia archaeon]
ATRCLRMALTYGTTIVRGFADVDNILGLMPVRAVLEVKRRLEQYMTLQVVAFPQEGIIHRDGVEELLWKAMEAGADVVGGIPFYEFTQEDAKRHIDKVFEIAKHFNKDIHVLADVDDDPNSKNLQYLAVKTQRERYEGRVAASYCTSLAYYHDTYARKVIELAAKANISVVSNPHLNLTATGRPDRQPLKRGLTRVRELIDAGVNVTSGQDDVDDPYYPFGKADMIEVGHYMAHTAQMTSETQIDVVYDMITKNGARALRIEDYGLQPGNRADLIVLDARSTIEAFRMMSERTYVISSGEIVAENSVTRKVLVS